MYGLLDDSPPAFVPPSLPQPHPPPCLSFRCPARNLQHPSLNQPCPLPRTSYPLSVIPDPDRESIPQGGVEGSSFPVAASLVGAFPGGVGPLMLRPSKYELGVARALLNHRVAPPRTRASPLPSRSPARDLSRPSLDPPHSLQLSLLPGIPLGKELSEIWLSQISDNSIKQGGRVGLHLLPGGPVGNSPKMLSLPIDFCVIRSILTFRPNVYTQTSQQITVNLPSPLQRGARSRGGWSFPGALPTPGCPRRFAAEKPPWPGSV